MQIDISDNTHFVLAVLVDGKIEIKTNIVDDLAVLIMYKKALTDIIDNSPFDIP